MHCYIDVFGFAQIGLSFTKNSLSKWMCSRETVILTNLSIVVLKRFWITNIEYKKSDNCT